MVLVTRIKGSSGSRLMPCSEAGILTESAICRLLADIERLLKSNCTVSEITEERDCWYFIENTDRVIISRCSLTYVPDEAKTAYLCRVKRLFGAE